MRGRGAAVVGVGLVVVAVVAVAATVLPWVQAAPPPPDCGWKCYVPLDRDGNALSSFAGESGWLVDAARQALGVGVALLAGTLAVLVVRGRRSPARTAERARTIVAAALLVVALAAVVTHVRFLTSGVDGDLAVRLGDRFALPEIGPGAWLAAAAATAAGVLAVVVLVGQLRGRRAGPIDARVGREASPAA